MALRELIVKIIADTAGFATKVSGAQGQLKEFGGKATETGLALTGLTGSLGIAGIGILKIAGDLEQTEIAFTTMLGSAEAAGEFLGELKDFAAGTPFEFPELLESSKRLLAMGFAASDVIPIMTSVGNAVAGLGGGGETIGRVTTALGQMGAKGKVSAEEMKQLTEAGIPAWQFLADAIGTDVAGAMELVQKRAIDSGPAIDAITDGMNQAFGGLMAEQMATFQGMLSNVQDALFFLAAEFGENLLPVGIRLMNEFGFPFIEMLGDLVQWFGDLTPGVQEAIVVFTGLLTAAGPVVTALGLAAVAVGALSLPVLALVAGITTAIGVFILWREEIEQFVVGLGVMFDEFLAGQPILAGALAAVKDIGGFIADKAIGIWEDFVSVVKELWGWVGKFVDLIQQKGKSALRDEAAAQLEAAQATDEHKKKVEAIQKAANEEAARLRALTTDVEKVGIAHEVAAKKLELFKDESGLVAQEAALVTLELEALIDEAEAAPPPLNSLTEAIGAPVIIEGTAAQRIGDIIEKIEKLSGNSIDTKVPVDNLTGALDALGVKSKGLKDKELADLKAALEEVRKQAAEGNQPAIDNLKAAEVAYAEALKKAGGPIENTGLWHGALQQVSTVITDLGDDLVGRFGTALNTGIGPIDDFKDAILRLVSEAVLGKLVGLLTGLISKIPGLNALGGALGGLFGGGGAAAGGAVAGGVGQAAGGVGGAAGGIGGAVGGIASAANPVGMITGIASLGAQIFGLFQNARQETTLNAIEENTRRGTLFLGDRADGGILGQLFKMNETLSFGTIVKAIERTRDMINDSAVNFWNDSRFHIPQQTRVLEQIRDAIWTGQQPVIVNLDGERVADVVEQRIAFRARFA